MATLLYIYKVVLKNSQTDPLLEYDQLTKKHRNFGEEILLDRNEKISEDLCRNCVIFVGELDLDFSKLTQISDFVIFYLNFGDSFMKEFNYFKKIVKMF